MPLVVDQQEGIDPSGEQLWAYCFFVQAFSWDMLEELWAGAPPMVGLVALASGNSEVVDSGDIHWAFLGSILVGIVEDNPVEEGNFASVGCSLETGPVDTIAGWSGEVVLAEVLAFEEHIAEQTDTGDELATAAAMAV